MLDLHDNTILKSLQMQRVINPSNFYLFLVPFQPNFDQQPFQTLNHSPGKFPVEGIRVYKSRSDCSSRVVWQLDYGKKYSWQTLEANLRTLWKKLEDLLKGLDGDPPASLCTWPWPSQYCYTGHFASFDVAQEQLLLARNAFLPLIALVTYHIARAEVLADWDWVEMVTQTTDLHPSWLSRIQYSDVCDEEVRMVGGVAEAQTWAPESLPMLDFIMAHFDVTVHVAWGDIQQVVSYEPRIHGPYRHFYASLQDLLTLRKWHRAQINESDSSSVHPPTGTHAIRLDLGVSNSASSASVGSTAIQQPERPATPQLQDHIPEEKSGQKPGETFEEFKMRRKHQALQWEKDETTKQRGIRMQKEKNAQEKGYPPKRSNVKVYEWDYEYHTGCYTRRRLTKAQYQECTHWPRKFVHYDGFRDEWDIYNPFHPLPTNPTPQDLDRALGEDPRPVFESDMGLEGGQGLLPDVGNNESLGKEAIHFLDDVNLGLTTEAHVPVTSLDEDALRQIALMFYGYFDDTTLILPNPRGQCIPIHRILTALGYTNYLHDASLISDGFKQRLSAFFHHEAADMMLAYVDFRYSNVFEYRFVKGSLRSWALLRPKYSQPYEVPFEIALDSTLGLVAALQHGDQWGPSIADLARNLAMVGITFSWFVLDRRPDVKEEKKRSTAATVPVRRMPRTKRPRRDITYRTAIGKRPKQYKPEKVDWKDYEDKVSSFIETPRGALALIYGGFVARVARRFVMGDITLDGPPIQPNDNDVSFHVDTGEKFFQICLSQEEEGIMCGAFNVVRK